MTDRKGGRQAFESEFGGFFSDGFLKAVAAVERRLVSQDCGGTYLQGEMCGLGYDPLNCAQDTPRDGYKFKTDSIEARRAVISMGWDAQGPAIATYRLVLVGGKWRIDALRCVDGDTFNW